MDPDISGTEIVYAKLNEAVQLTYNATDDGTYSFVFLDQPATDFAVNYSSGQAVVTWTPQSTDEVNIR